MILPFCQSVAETGGRKQFGTVFDYKIVQGCANSGSPKSCANNGSPVGLTNSGAKGTNNGSKATNNGSPTAHVSATSQFRERSEPSFVSETNHFRERSEQK